MLDILHDSVENTAKFACYNRFFALVVPFSYGGSSSTGRAPDCGSGRCGFDSHLPPQSCALFPATCLKLKGQQGALSTPEASSFTPVFSVTTYEPHCWKLRAYHRSLPVCINLAL